LGVDPRCAKPDDGRGSDQRESHVAPTHHVASTHHVAPTHDRGVGLFAAV